jgi:hypothetical protein
MAMLFEDVGRKERSTAGLPEFIGSAERTKLSGSANSAIIRTEPGEMAEWLKAAVC